MSITCCAQVYAEISIDKEITANTFIMIYLWILNRKIKKLARNQKIDILW